MVSFGIVGGGIFGSVIARWLRLHGAYVLVFDEGRVNSGSAPAACLMKPSWASSMNSTEYIQARADLNHSYGVQKVVLQAPMGVSMEFDWVPPKSILIGPDFKGKVTSVRPGEIDAVVESPGTGAATWKFDHVIVATGHWAKELVPGLKARVYGRGGWAITRKGQLETPFVRPWAPYRQLIGFNRGPDEIWVGDGTALKPESMTIDARDKSFKRMQESLPYIDPTEDQQIIAGIRPYFDGPKAPALIEHVAPGLLVATGGAKNGTLGAAWAARKIAEELL